MGDERLGPYRLGRELGRGGMAQVFLAEGPKGEQVVLKRMLPTIARNEQARELFRREAKVATLLRHPHVVHVLELIEEGDELALVMEYLEGLTLRDVSHRAWLNGRALPLEPLVQAMIEAALALHHAHHLEVRGREVCVVHRDVSPDNLVLTTSGITKLIDFGVAKPEQGADLTVGGQLRGKPSYMAPEQVQGSRVDGRADLWSLGVSFFYLLTGRRPFKRDSAVETMRAIVQDDPPSMRELNPRLPRELALVVRGLLVRDPARRTSTGAEVAAQLTALVHHLDRGYLTSGRLLATVEDLDEDGNGENPEVAALPSLDWSAGQRLPDVVYESTRMLDPSATPTLARGSTRVPLVGALEMPEDQKDEGPELGHTTNIVQTDPEPPPRPASESQELAAQATMLLMRDEMIVPRSDPEAEKAALDLAADEGSESAPTMLWDAPQISEDGKIIRPEQESPTSPVPALGQADDDDEEEEHDDLPRTVLMNAHEMGVRTGGNERAGGVRLLRTALAVGLLSFLLTAAIVAGLLFGGVIELKGVKLPFEVPGAAPVQSAPERDTQAP